MRHCTCRKYGNSGNTSVETRIFSRKHNLRRSWLWYKYFSIPTLYNLCYTDINCTKLGKKKYKIRIALECLKSNPSESTCSIKIISISTSLSSICWNTNICIHLYMYACLAERVDIGTLELFWSNIKNHLSLLTAEW